MSDKLRKVDVRSRKPLLRHLAVINNIRTPFDGGKRILDSEIAATVCGRFVRYYTIADDHSYLYTDGSTYAVACPVCLPNEVTQ